MPSFFYQGQKILDAEGGLGQVWLSGLHFAQNGALLRENKITAVVSAVDLSIDYDPSLTVHKLNLRDNEDEEVRYTFFPVFRFIDQERKKGNVLIHCAAGISRSATLLISYLMNKYQTTYEDCLVLIVTKRPCVSPNSGFVKQLKKFQSDLGIKDGANYFN